MLSVPRRVVNTDVTKIAYHGFSDASKLAVSAALYALVFHKAAPVCQSLLVAKSKKAASCKLQAASCNSQSHAWSLSLHTHFASSDESCEGKIIRSAS